MTTILTIRDIGSSRGVILPQKVLRMMGAEEKLSLTVNDDGSGTLEAVRSPEAGLKRKPLSKRMKSLLDERVAFSQEEVQSDERLSYVLGK